LIQFSFLTLKLCGFSSFNKILLSLFNISNTIHDSFLVNIGKKNVSNGVNNSDIIMK